MTTRRTFAAILLCFGLAGLLASPHIAFAQQRSEAGQDALKFLDATAVKGGLTGAIKADDYRSESAVLGIIGNIVNVILGFVGIIFFIQLFYAGFRWMSSGGNEEVVTESRATIKSAVIGIVVVFGAFVITNFVLNQIANITGPARPTVPVGESTGDLGDPYAGSSGIDPYDISDVPLPTLGTCLYPIGGECFGGSSVWSGRIENISQADCATRVMSFANVTCGNPTLYEWP